MTEVAGDELARLPRVDTLVGQARDLVEHYGREPATAALREALETARQRLLAAPPDDGDAPAVAPSSEELVAQARTELARRRPGPPRRVINAAGVVVHTNLGRAPLSQAAREAVDAAAGYCDLEYDLASGERGSRESSLRPVLTEMSGAEDALAVNNAAGALVLALASLAAGRDVLVSRGELVEIGGSFRLPEIMAASGARLVEVGTTNRTRASDYAPGAHQNRDVAAILKVHQSNYAVTGFSEEPSVGELVEQAGAWRCPLLYDTGSGLVDERSEPWLTGEPSLRGALAAGADLVLCSGDKLLGGPQSGLLTGRAELVGACRQNPLARTLRLDKLRVAALVATLEAQLADSGAPPVERMLSTGDEELQARTTRVAAALDVDVVQGASVVGGGAAPGKEIPGPVIRVPAAAPGELAARLRGGDPPVIARVANEALWIDLRTVDVDDDELLVRRVVDARR
jgi:L-seryl-tRNA(Ser) seleniumtransferase